MESETSRDSCAHIEQSIREARQGSTEAMGRLWEAFQEYLWLVARDGLDPRLRGKMGASDIVQETFLEAQRDFHAFRGVTREQLLAWLRRLLLNNLMNHRRLFRHTLKRDLKRETSASGSNRRADPLASDDTTPSQVAVRREEEQLLEKALECLPELYRRIIILRNREQRSFAEIGDLTQRSPDAARMLWSRAFERLAEELNGLP
jgi:RNA polymerase sigma-70 factor (ECF subfamily)